MPRRSEAVQLAELELLRALLSNPVFSFVAGFAILELLQHHKVTGSLETTTAEIALGTIAGAQALSPVLPVLASSGGDLLKGLIAARVPAALLK